MPTPEMDSRHESGGAVSEQVLAGTARREERNPLDFDDPLYDVIDPDARNRIFQSNGTNRQIEFTYLGYEVAVFSDGRITLNQINA